MTGKILKQGELIEADIFMSAVKNISKPVLRSVIKQSIKIFSLESFCWRSNDSGGCFEEYIRE